MADQHFLVKNIILLHVKQSATKDGQLPACCLHAWVSWVRPGPLSAHDGDRKPQNFASVRPLLLPVMRQLFWQLVHAAYASAGAHCLFSSDRACCCVFSKPSLAYFVMRLASSPPAHAPQSPSGLEVAHMPHTGAHQRWHSICPARTLAKAASRSASRARHSSIACCQHRLQKSAADAANTGV